MALVLTVSAGCATTLPPFLSAQTADVLAPGQIAVAGGGGATFLTDLQSFAGCCAGGDVRVRAGIGGGQELSLDVGLTGVGGAYGISARAGWKRQLVPWAAIHASLDVLVHDTPGEIGRQIVVAPGGDFGATLSTPARGRMKRVQLYCGARLALHVPALRDPLSGPGVILDASVPAGVAFHTSASTRLYVEGGVVTVATWYRAAAVVESFALGGLYGALAFEVLIP